MPLTSDAGSRDREGDRKRRGDGEEEPDGHGEAGTGVRGDKEWRRRCENAGTGTRRH